MASQISESANGNLSGKKTYSGKLFSEENHFVNANHNYIYCRYWTPAEKPRALMLIVHGFGEHSGRHNIIAKNFVETGFLVFSHDHFCHGESEGFRLDIENYEVFLNDMEQHCSIMKEKYPDLPLFVYGHSMGGALAILFVQRSKHVVKHVVLSSPMIAKNKQMTQPKILLARMLSTALPRLAVGALDTSYISHKEEEVDRYNKDALVYHGKVMMRTGVQLYNLADAVQKILPEISFSYLVLHGDHDELCDVSGTKLLHEQSKSSDKTMKVFVGGFHELVHDSDSISSEFVDYILDWVKHRLAGTDRS